MKIPKFDARRMKRWLREIRRTAPGKYKMFRRRIQAYREPIRKFAETYPTPKEMLTYVRQPPRQLIPWGSILGTPAPYRPALPKSATTLPKIKPLKPTRKVPPQARRQPNILYDVGNQTRDMLKDIMGGKR